MPPFDKALMDGYVHRSAEGAGAYPVAGEVLAGHRPGATLPPGACLRIMTGAPIPTGGDAVTPREEAREVGGGQVALPSTEPGRNILRRGTEYRRGDTVVPAGVRLRPQEVGVLAAVGRTQVLCHPRPRVAVLATGDELVEAAAQPEEGQLRSSNGPMLVALAERAGAEARSLGIARDCPEALARLIELGLADDVLILAGGVSEGKLDLVPAVLESLGAQAIFHKVNIKPGKPLLFATSKEGKLVFGLPGNPVSAFVTFEVFVRPALGALAGRPNAGLPTARARLLEALAHSSDRPTYHPAHLEGEGVRAVPWRASADLASLLPANALVVLPAGKHLFPAGEMMDVMALDG
jgi:molybdopterin molybdotransferase